MTFGLVYMVYATAVDPKKGSLGTITPIAIGFIVGANILVGGAFSKASMNPPPLRPASLDGSGGGDPHRRVTSVEVKSSSDRSQDEEKQQGVTTNEVTFHNQLVVIELV
ncbi:hypothetical protein ZWY2020_050468 [Hordeum vulgare]|nr:hypothetical protein ZWY2020_050468 [Hordeum vulgare]